MANTIKIKRGPSSNVYNAHLEEGELAITTDTHELFVGTGPSKIPEKVTDYPKNIVDGSAYGAKSIYATKSSGQNSLAFGSQTKALGDNSQALGYGTESSGNCSHAEGWESTASGDYSHAEGNATRTKTKGWASHAEGFYTVAAGENQHVQGKYNIEDTTSAHIVGNGENTSIRSNAHTLDWLGNAWFAGDVYIKSTSGTNKDSGSKKLATEEFVATQIENSIPISDTPPENPSNGDLWIDTSEDGFLAEIDNTVSTTSENAVSNKAITTYVNSLKGKLLWTNPNGYINQEFASQTLTFEDNYDHYDIIYAQDGISLKCDRVYVNANVAYILQSNLGGYIRTRRVAAYGNSMLFDDGYFYTTYATGTMNNNQCIPYKIIGYK